MLQSQLVHDTSTRTFASQQMTVDQCLDRATQLIGACYETDRKFNDLKYKLKLDRLDQPTVSGLNERDYPNYDSLHFGAHTEFACVRKHCLPTELTEQILRMECNFAMGLFADVNRAWVTVDGTLFVWNFNNNCDLAYYDQIPNTILRLHLCRPKLNSLGTSSSVQFILTVVTSVDVILLGVNFFDSNGSATDDYRNAEMHLVPEPLFKCSMNGVIASDVCSNSDGQIFLAGRDGCLYEIKYQAGGMFGRYCKKINHSKGIMSYIVPSVVAFTFGKDEPLAEICVDKSRHILYTRSDKGSVQVFDISDQQVYKCATLTAAEIQYACGRIVQTVEPNHFKLVVSISVIESDESTVLNLVGVTQSGIRLYFTCYFNEDGSTRAKPQTLKVAHIRFPPGFCPSSSNIRPEHVHRIFSKRETCFNVSAYDEQTDLIWCFSNANFPYRANFLETHMQQTVKGRIWVLDEVCTGLMGGGNRCFKRFTVGQLSPPLVVTQHNEPAKQFIVLTPQVYIFVERRRPVDILKQLLVDYGPDSPNVQAFFQLHQPAQSGAMCILLACASVQHERQAMRALNLFGAEPKLIYAHDATFGQCTFDGSFYSPLPHKAPSTHITSTPAAAALSAPQSTFRTAPRTIVDQSSLIGGGDFNLTTTTTANQNIARGATPVDVKFSDRHNSYYLYMSRILGYIWQANIFADRKITYANKSIDVLDCTMISEEINLLAEQVRRFVDVLRQYGGLPQNLVRQQHFELTNIMPPDLVNASFSSAHSHQPLKSDDVEAVEQQSMMALYFFAQRCCEVLGLLRVLSDHQMHVIIALLTKEQQEKLRIMTFDRLVVDGKTLLSDLVLCLMNQYLADRATTDAISDRLRQVCPSLFTSDDATSTKANELLLASKATEDDSERTVAVDKALDMYKKIAHQIHLPSVCAQLEETQNFESIVDLCLCAAHKIDPANMALNFYRRFDIDGDLDPMRKNILMSRLACYKCMTDTMNRLMNAASGTHPAIPAQQAKHWLDAMLKAALADRSDELCHVSVFDWLTERQALRDVALTCQSPYLERYLLRRATEADEASSAAPHMRRGSNVGDSRVFADMLWRLYEHERRFGEAARVLEQLAERHGITTDLSQRVTYLSRAVLCCKASSELSSSQAKLCHDLEDKLEVANLQLHIVETLKQMPQTNDVRTAVAKLNMDLLDVTQLYTDYAEHFKLTECKLAIISCAGLTDPTRVESLWRDIIDKELCNHAREATSVKSRLLTDKMKNLFELYNNSPKFLPLTFLIKYLFAKSIDNDFDEHWIVDTMLLCGVSHLDIFTILDATFKQWTTAIVKKDRRLQIYVLKSLHALMDNFCQRTDKVSHKERLCQLLLDSIAFYTVELDTMPSGSESNNLKRLFSDIKSTLTCDY